MPKAFVTCTCRVVGTLVATIGWCNVGLYVPYVVTLLN